MKHFFFILVIFGLTACNNGFVNQLVATPEIEQVRLSHFSAKDKQAILLVTLYNPNPYPLPITSLAGDITLNTIQVGSLAATADKQLAAYDTQSITMPLTLDSNALLNAAQSVLLQGKAGYQFEGYIYTSLGKVPINKQGELSPQDLLRSASSQ